MHEIRVKRVYEEPDPADGYRVLVDRVWPRGLSKEKVRADEWLKDTAPSNELRKWFGHDPDKWQEFQRRYSSELAERKEAVQSLLDAAGKSVVTLLYSAKDEEHNQAVALKAYLQKHGA